MIHKYFLSFCGLSFHFLDGVLLCLKAFNFNKVENIEFSCVTCVFGVISKLPLIKLKIMKLYPYVFFKECHSFSPDI